MQLGENGEKQSSQLYCLQVHDYKSTVLQMISYLIIADSSQFTPISKSI